jgi:hypothetical protein
MNCCFMPTHNNEKMGGSADCVLEDALDSIVELSKEALLPENRPAWKGAFYGILLSAFIILAEINWNIF